MMNQNFYHQRRLTQTVFLRPAVMDDTQAVVDLVTVVFAEYDYPIELENLDKDLTDLEEHYGHPKSCFLVLEQESTDAKTKKLMASGALKYLDDDHAELYRFYFYPEFRGQGLAKQLLDELIAFAKTMAYRQIILETHTTMGEAVAFYRKHGFQEIPVYSGRPSEYCDIAFKFSF